MASRFRMLLPRFVALTVVWLLGASTYTLAAGNQATQPVPEVLPAQQKTDFLLVPDVRGQAYVFAKGILQDGGFAWKVEGDVRGYAGNTVGVQSPAPGVKVVDNGFPTVTLRLARNAAYEERGIPEGKSPYAGDRIVLASEWAALQKTRKKQETEKEVPPEPPAEEPAEEPAEPEAPETRKPDFEVPGAPAEPASEMPLPERARLLGRRLGASSHSTKALVNYWLYQHSWIVTGARFGWSDGAEALRILIRVDRDLQARWGFGAKSARVARAALREVESKLAR